MTSKRAQTVIAPKRDELEPIEIASRDEIEALQLSRLKATLQHAYDNVGAYRRKFDAAGVHPRDLKCLADLRRFPFTSKDDLRDNYPFGMFAVPREQVRAHPRVVGHDRQGDGRRLYRARSQDLVRPHGAVAARRRLPAGHARACVLWIWPFHRRARRALRRRTARHDRRADRLAA